MKAGRTSRYALGQAIIRLMLERGLDHASLDYVLNNIHSVIELTPSDRHFVPSRPRDFYFQNDIRNISRNQDRSPPYAKYKPIPGLDALSYSRNRRGGTGTFFLDRSKIIDGGDQ